MMCLGRWQMLGGVYGFFCTFIMTVYVQKGTNAHSPKSIMTKQKETLSLGIKSKSKSFRDVFHSVFQDKNTQ